VRGNIIDWHMSYTVRSLNPTGSNPASKVEYVRGNIAWHMSFTMTVWSVNPTQSNLKRERIVSVDARTHLLFSATHHRC